MLKLLRLARWSLAALVFAFPAAAAAQGKPAQDSQAERQQVQPYNNAPVWRDVRKEGQEHYTSIKGRETGVLVQSAGETWRQIRNNLVTVWGGFALIIALAIIAAIYFAVGPVKTHDKPTGRMVPRFSQIERWAHWTVAISFCVLAVSGLVMLFGKHVLLPLIGYTLFSWLTSLLKNLHNFVSPVFILSVPVLVLIFIRDNLPKSYDFAWFAKAWGLFMRNEHIPSGRFNGGEKVWFWGFVVGLTIVSSVTGLILLFPNFDQTRSTMQLAWIFHALSALLFILGALGHIYVGTIGVEDAYQCMRTGYVDEAWAKEHHEYWYNDIKSNAGGGAPAAAGGAVPAGAPQAERK
ncbi:MAG: formate dehydrogenase subunit gamma [Betaproteobacteria bacterium]|nr:formate dehydrogenase subunit gamma [Betaproteobacteria bacterium]